MQTLTRVLIRVLHNLTIVDTPEFVMNAEFRKLINSSESKGEMFQYERYECMMMTEQQKILIKRSSTSFVFSRWNSFTTVTNVQKFIDAVKPTEFKYINSAEYNEVTEEKEETHTLYWYK